MTPVTVSRPPTLLDVLAWLWRWFLDSLVALLTHPSAGRHSGHVGATPEYADVLADVREALTDTETFPAVEDVTETGFAVLHGDLADTVAFTWLDRLDADKTYAATMRLLGEWPPDATEVALTAAVRMAGGA